MLVSVIIRSIGRDIIFRALKSLENQTLKDFEVIIIEDGSCNLGNKLPQTLNIRYYGIDHQVGRSAAGNLGMSMAQGKYLIFLDDDDEFLPNHLENLVRIARGEDIVVASSSLEIGESEDQKLRTKPYKLYQKHDKSDIYVKNFLPINAVLFPKKLFDIHGGFDTDLHALEDWVLWAKYLKFSNLRYSNNATAIYYVPFSLKKYFSRRKIIKNYYTEAAKRVRAFAQGQNLPTLTSNKKKLKEMCNKALMLFKIVWYRVLGKICNLLKGFNGRGYFT